MFSIDARAQATGMASQTQNIAQSISGQFCLLFLNKRRFPCFLFQVVINIILAVFVCYAVTDSKEVSLEEMEAFLGGFNYTSGKKWRDIKTAAEAEEEWESWKQRN